MPDRSTRYHMSTQDLVLAIDAPGTADGYKFLEKYRRNDKRFKRCKIGAYIPFTGQLPPLHQVYPACKNPFFSGIHAPIGTDFEQRLASATLSNNTALVEAIRQEAKTATESDPYSQRNWINENVVQALVMLAQGVTV